MIEFRVLGALQVMNEGVPVPVPSRTQRALICRLLLGGGHVVPVGALADAIWAEDPPDRAAHALQMHISRLRALLGPARQLLATRSPGYLLDTDSATVDARQFEAAVRRAGELMPESPADALRVLDEALVLWHGPAFAEFADTFARPAAARLDELRLLAREERCEALLLTGALEPAVAELGELVAGHPLRERPHGQLIRALYLTGRQADALAVYQGFRDRIRDELGLEPSPMLDRVRLQVLRQEIPARAARAQPTLARPGTATVLAPPAPVPTPLTRLIGRERELKQLRELIERARIVTLVGPGGVGKTRLAQELVAGRGTSDSDHRPTAMVVPAYWVDLTPARDPADVPHRFIAALGLHEPTEGRIDDFLVRTLHSARAVIVVDNCEHVIAAAAQIIEQIARTCPGAVLVATSRERLAVAGEQVVAVPPLPVDPDGDADVDRLREAPAVALFADRTRAAGGPELTARDVPLVAQLCRSVDGLPLAIELAAARARGLGLTGVASRPALDVLAGGWRTADERHRSVRAVLDWSYQLLDADEQTLFRRLSSFKSTFTVDDVEGVCGDPALPPGHVAGALASLVDKSMVSVTGTTSGDRYRLLATIRAYAADLLTSHHEELQLGRAHAGYFVRFAEQAALGLRTAEEATWAARLTDRSDELRAAHRWACVHDADLAVRLAAALAGYARLRMRFEMQEWAEAAANLPGAIGHPLRVVAFGSAACGAWARGDFAHAAALARQGLAVTGPEDPLAADAVLVLGDVALLEGRFTEAAERYATAARRARGSDPQLHAEALGSQAIALSYRGETAAALRLADASMRAAQDAGSPGEIAFSLYFAGESRLESDPTAALEFFAEARRLAAGVGALLVEGLATLSSVSVQARAGAEPTVALAAYREAIEHWRRVGNRTQQWITLRNLVPVLVKLGQAECACAIHGALTSAPVRFTHDVPEADLVGAAIAEARRDLGDQSARRAGERGARLTLDDLVDQVLATIEATVPAWAAPTGPALVALPGVQPVEAPQVVLDG